MTQVRTIVTSGSIPTTNQLALGDIAINTYDGKAYIKKAVGTTQTVLEIGAGVTPISASYALTASYATNFKVSGSITDVDYIDFDTGSATPAWKSGRVFWDNTEGALSVYNAEQEVTLNVGQENWTRVSNRTGATILNGTVVRIKGAHGDVPEVELAQSLLVSGSVNLLNQILGVATHDIEDNSKGYVTTQGLVRGLNTNAFNDGDTLFVGTGSAGVLQNIPPIAPYEIIPVGVCVKASPGGSGIIYVAVQEPIDFSDLSSALVSGTYSYGDIWTYVQSGSAGVWTHTNQLSGSYGVTGSLKVLGAVTASSFTGSFTGSFFGTASYALTSSFAISSSRTVSSSFASTASFVNTLSQNVIVSGSLTVTASINGVTLDNTAWTAYTPTWTAASVNPSIGNGTIEGYYKLIGKTCFVRGNIAMGSTTTFGSGEWYVGMPFTASHADAILMTANLLDNGTAWYNATVNGARAGFNYKSAIQYQATGGTANDVNSNQPFTWTNTDRFLWNGCYQIA